MEIVVMLFVLVGASIAFSAYKNKKKGDGSQPADNNDQIATPSIRKCLACGYEGEMKTWISAYTVPKLLLVAGFILGYLPGIIFLAVYWGKCKCPGCGAIGKNEKIVEAK